MILVKLSNADCAQATLWAGYIRCYLVGGGGSAKVACTPVVGHGADVRRCLMLHLLREREELLPDHTWGSRTLNQLTQAPHGRCEDGEYSEIGLHEVV